MQDISPAITDCSGKDIEKGWFPAVQVEEDAAPLKVGLALVADQRANTLEQGVSWRNPFKCGIGLKELFREHDVLVLVAEFTEARFNLLAAQEQRSRKTSNPVNVLPTSVKPGHNARNWCSLRKEVLDDLRNKTALFGLLGLADDGGEVNLPLGQTLKGRFGDASQTLGINLRDNTVLDHVFGEIPGIQFPNHSLKLVGREDIAQDVEDLAVTLGV